MPCSEPISWLRLTSSTRRAYEELDAGSSPRFWVPPLVRDGNITGLFQLCSLCAPLLGSSATVASVTAASMLPLSLPSLPLLLEPLLLLLEVLLLLLPELLLPEVLLLFLERGEGASLSPLSLIHI